MKCLYVLYDAECGFCEKCRDWLIRQPKFVELRFIPMQSEEVLHRFPGIENLGLGQDLLVISDQGAVYRDSSAWIMCLYALVEYREWSQRLAHPVLRPLARRLFVTLSNNRKRISHFLHWSPEQLKEHLEPGPISCLRERREASRRY